MFVRYFVFTFYRVSYCRMAANLPSKVVIPLLPVSSVRAGPHYSLLRLLALRLQSLILDSPSLSLPVMLQAQALSPRSTKLPWMCTAIHTRQTRPNISSHCCEESKTLCQLALNLGQKDIIWHKATGNVRAQYKHLFYT